MAEQGTVTLYNSTIISDPNANPFSFKAGIAQSMLRGGAIFHVSSPPQAKIAEQAGACAVLASTPRQHHHHGIPRMIDPSLLKDIKHAVSIPVISNVRVGHFVEAQILQSLGVDYIDESEVFGLADDKNFINKHNFRCPFVCGVKDLGEAVRRIREGAAMIRTKGDFSNSGNIVETVRNVRCVKGQIRKLSNMDDDEVFAYAKEIEAPYDLVAQIKAMGRLPVVHFAAGGIVTPADVAMMMQLGCDGVFVGPDVFDCGDPYKRARGIVEAVTNYSDPDVLARCCHGLNEAMADLSVRENNDRIEHFGGSTA